jgi:hypothetical protein
MSDNTGKYRWLPFTEPFVEFAVLLGNLAYRSTLPVTIYLSQEAIHDRVEAAVDDLLATAGLRIVARDKPVIGSWSRSMRARPGRAARSPAAGEMTNVMLHAADTRLVLAQDAVTTANLMQQLGPVLTALHPTKDAVLRVGALLIVKVDWIVTVHQLTAAQQLKLDHRPQLATSPHEIIAALGPITSSEVGDPHALRSEPT